MNKKILIIPDVHGRTFWESALKSGDYEKIVFLGDYTDPYEMEGITNRDALKNFKSIVAFKQQNPKPVLVMRDTTERPEALESGTVHLVGTDHDLIVNEVSTLLDDRKAYEKMSKAVNPYGDGNACSRIVKVLL